MPKMESKETIRADSLDLQDNLHCFCLVTHFDREKEPAFLRPSDIDLWKLQGATIQQDFEDEDEYYLALGEWVTKNYQDPGFDMFMRQLRVSWGFMDWVPSGRKLS